MPEILGELLDALRLLKSAVDAKSKFFGAEMDVLKYDAWVLGMAGRTIVEILKKRRDHANDLVGNCDLWIRKAEEAKEAAEVNAIYKISIDPGGQTSGQTGDREPKFPTRLISKYQVLRVRQLLLKIKGN